MMQMSASTVAPAGNFLASTNIPMNEYAGEACREQPLAGYIPFSDDL
jgi:hypothetical protein